MKEDKNTTLLKQPGLNVSYLSFNTEKKPLDDVKVRQGADLRGQQRSDHQSGLPGRRPGGEEPDPADHVGL
ncbi:hypothetical protein MJ560_26975 [Klebsiella pneumoniae]|nr:hypothetical protein MJ560_26975 [Klebsiella pneumoniae]